MDVIQKQASRPRRLFRFSLLSFFIFIAGVAILTNWLIDRVQRHAQQMDVASELVDVSVVNLTNDLTDRHSVGRSGGNHVTIERATGWENTIAGWLGLRYEADVIGLSVRVNDNEWDNVFAMISSFPKLRSINLMDCHVTDDMLDDLRRVQLDAISFSNTDISKKCAIDLKEALPDARIAAFHDEYYPMTKSHKGMVIDFELP
jgi:hypothetical protein